MADESESPQSPVSLLTARLLCVFATFFSTSQVTFSILSIVMTGFLPSCLEESIMSVSEPIGI